MTLATFALLPTGVMSGGAMLSGPVLQAAAQRLPTAGVQPPRGHDADTGGRAWPVPLRTNKIPDHAFH